MSQLKGSWAAGQWGLSLGLGQRLLWVVGYRGGGQGQGSLLLPRGSHREPAGCPELCLDPTEARQRSLPRDRSVEPQVQANHRPSALLKHLLRTCRPQGAERRPARPGECGDRGREGAWGTWDQEDTGRAGCQRGVSKAPKMSEPTKGPSGGCALRTPKVLLTPISQMWEWRPQGDGAGEVGAGTGLGSAGGATGC